MNRLHSELIKVYFSFLALPAYCVFAPIIWSQNLLLGTLFLLFPGLYLYIYMVFIIHEAYHKYFKGYHDFFIFRIASIYVFGDIQVYKIVHPLHHVYVHTEKDLEINPFGKILSKKLKFLDRILELTLGLIYTQFSIIFKIITDSKLRKKLSFFKMFLNFSMSFLFYFFTGYLSFSLGANINSILLCYIFTILVFSVLARIIQLIEHGDIFSDSANYKERNMLTRNLSKNTLLEKIYHFYTRNDSYNHTMHHLKASEFHRLTEENSNKAHDSHNYISLKDFFNVILFSLFRKKQ